MLLSTLVLVALIFLLAGLVKGVIGMGLPTVGMGLLGLAMAPAEAAAVLVLPSLVTNLWQGLVGGALMALLRRLWPLLLASAFGTWLTAGLLTGEDPQPARFALGLALVLYALAGLSRASMSVPLRVEPWLSPAAGLLTGLVTGATGVFVMPSVPYLQAIGLERDGLVQAMGLSFTVSTLALGAVLARAGAFDLPLAGGAVLALAASLLGMVAGRGLRARLRPALFRGCFFAGLLLLGAVLALRAAF